MPDNWRWHIRSSGERPAITVVASESDRPFGFSRAFTEHLACDGPANGRYIGTAEAESNGYELDKWPTGETVWMQPNVKEDQQNA